MGDSVVLDPFWLLAAADIVGNLRLLCVLVTVFALPLALLWLANLDDQPPGPARRLPYALVGLTAFLALLVTLTPSPKTLQAAALAAATDPAVHAAIQSRLDKQSQP